MSRRWVTPDAALHPTEGRRGDLMGNRGILTGNRRWATKAWITCVLELKGWSAASSKYTRHLPKARLRRLQPPTAGDITSLRRRTA